MQAGIVFVIAIGLASAAHAQMIRPDSATATSEFSSGYTAANAINGSGLPAGFGPGDAHATYDAGNHWTTRFRETIGQSATFTFNAPQTLGGFYMWAHRSNNIANNPYYAVTLFDLVLRDGPNGTGNVLANFTNLTGVPDVATAQTIPFTLTPGVRSVQFIVRATTNNNSSPYTGLAEAAFAPCLEVRVVAPPAPLALCPGGEAVFSVGVFGTGAVVYRWRKDEIDIDQIANPSAATATLVLHGVQGQDAGEYDCVVTNPCGSDTSAAGILSICLADTNCDGTADFNDYLEFLNLYNSNDLRVDFNGDGAVDFNDYLEFLNLYNAC